MKILDNSRKKILSGQVEETVRIFRSCVLRCYRILPALGSGIITGRGKKGEQQRWHPGGLLSGDQYDSVLLQSVFQPDNATHCILSICSADALCARNGYFARKKVSPSLVKRDFLTILVIVIDIADPAASQADDLVEREIEILLDRVAGVLQDIDEPLEPFIALGDILIRKAGVRDVLAYSYDADDAARSIPPGSLVHEQGPGDALDDYRFDAFPDETARNDQRIVLAECAGEITGDELLVGTANNLFRVVPEQARRRAVNHSVRAHGVLGEDTPRSAFDDGREQVLLADELVLGALVLRDVARLQKVMVRDARRLGEHQKPVLDELLHALALGAVPLQYDESRILAGIRLTGYGHLEPALPVREFQLVLLAEREAGLVRFAYRRQHGIVRGRGKARIQLRASQPHGRRNRGAFMGCVVLIAEPVQAHLGEGIGQRGKHRLQLAVGLLDALVRVEQLEGHFNGRVEDRRAGVLHHIAIRGDFFGLLHHGRLRMAGQEDHGDLVDLQYRRGSLGPVDFGAEIDIHQYAIYSGVALEAFYRPLSGMGQDHCVPIRFQRFLLGQRYDRFVLDEEYGSDISFAHDLQSLRHYVSRIEITLPHIKIVYGIVVNKVILTSVVIDMCADVRILA